MLLLIYFNASLLFKSINFTKKGIILKKGKEQQQQEIQYHQR